MDLTIIIVNWNTRELLLQCLQSIYGGGCGIPFQVCLVDNGSRDGSADAVARDFPAVRIVRNQRNAGFAAANNQILREITTPFVLLLNTDTKVTGGAIDKLVDFMRSHPKAGMVCGQLLNADGSKQNSFASFPSFSTLLFGESILHFFMPAHYPNKRGEYPLPIPIDSGIGACLLVRKKAIDAVGILDERYFFFLEETDWARRMREKGWLSYFVPDAGIYHFQGQSAGQGVHSRKMFYRSRNLYFQKWFPRTWPLFAAVIWGKLLFNLGSNCLFLLLGLGKSAGVRQKVGIHWQLLLWHLQGCPADRR